jgi:hypothetical protein
MLAGIGPILGDGSVGSFVANDGNVSWFYQDGKTGTRNPAGLETVSLTLQEEPVLQTSSVAPVAVLVDNSTASSAEAITIAFHGRPASRSFGSRTAGKSTAVQPFKLDDGAELYLTTAIDADRSGKAYPDGFTPDQVISFNGGTMPLENNDQVLVAAQAWLVASTTTVVAPQPPATLKSKLRRKKAAAPQNLASTPAPAQQPSSAPAVTAAQTPAAVVAVQTPANAPAAAAVEAPATIPAAVVATAPAPAAAVPVTPVPEATVAQAPAPAPAPAVAQTPNSADVATPIQAIAPPPAPVTPPAQTSAPAMVASTTPATPAAPPAPKPKVQHKKVVVHEGS